MKKDDKKSKRPIGLYSFCPKHNVFYASCGCSFKKKVEVEEDIEPIDPKTL